MKGLRILYQAAHPPRSSSRTSVHGRDRPLAGEGQEVAAAAQLPRGLLTTRSGCSVGPLARKPTGDRPGTSLSLNPTHQEKLLHSQPGEQGKGPGARILVGYVCGPPTLPVGRCRDVLGRQGETG